MPKTETKDIALSDPKFSTRQSDDMPNGLYLNGNIITVTYPSITAKKDAEKFLQKEYTLIITICIHIISAIRSTNPITNIESTPLPVASP
ncbi:hypothetical protein FACS1894120_5230 [Clostridia bacterium]|nr:hypothetical protein FACS1894120_5230 [Clostridia bacterium]